MPAVRKSPAVQQEEVIKKTLKKALVDKGWQSQHLAKLCGMEPSRISLILNHPMNVKFDTILMIAAKLGVNSIPIVK